VHHLPSVRRTLKCRKTPQKIGNFVFWLEWESRGHERLERTATDRTENNSYKMGCRRLFGELSPRGARGREGIQSDLGLRGGRRRLLAAVIVLSVQVSAWAWVPNSPGIAQHGRSSSRLHVKQASSAISETVQSPSDSWIAQQLEATTDVKSSTIPIPFSRNDALQDPVVGPARVLVYDTTLRGTWRQR
jgi:hypothetical protein